MRKIIALILVLTIAVLFAGCGDNKEEQTTLDPLYTAYSPITTTQSSGQNTGATGATYILTTNPGQTVPSLNTTRFTANVAATTVNPLATSNTNTYDTTSGVITVPSASAVTSNAASTTWQTVPSTITTTATTTRATTTTRVTTTAPTTQPTTKAEPQPVNIVINDMFIDSQGRVCAAIDNSNWGGKLKSNSQRVAVSIDGVEMDSGAMLQITSTTNGDGFQYVYLDLADYEIDTSSCTVSFVIPEGFLENKTGTKYNYALDVSL